MGSGEDMAWWPGSCIVGRVDMREILRVPEGDSARGTFTLAMRVTFRLWTVALDGVSSVIDAAAKGCVVRACSSATTRILAFPQREWPCVSDPIEGERTSCVRPLNRRRRTQVSRLRCQRAGGPRERVSRADLRSCSAPERAVYAANRVKQSLVYLYAIVH